MSRIDIENAKTLRPAMKVICGLDVEEGDIDSVSATNSYDNYVGDLTSVIMPEVFMDLIGDGFMNDGNAVPLPEDHAGIVQKVNYQMVINITLDASVGAGTPITVYGYEGSGLKKWTGTTVSGTSQSITIAASSQRIFITKVNVGDSWWFDNSNLISCDVQLRGVETTVDNPSLQMSEIEIKGYEPNDITELLDKIDEDNPIYYSAGYEGDMSPVRKFYLSDMVEWDNNIITIKGADATKFLDSDYDGKYYTADSYKKAIEDILTSAGISYTETGTESASMTPLLVPNGSVRDFIAQTCNLVRGYDTYNSRLIAYDYVDAGRPKLKIWSPPTSASAVDIDNIADLKRSVGKAAKGINLSIVSPVAETVDTELQTLEMTSGVTYWIDSSEPCLSFSCTGGTVTMLSPYKVKIVATQTGEYAVNGKVIKSIVPASLGNFVGSGFNWEVPMTISWGRNYGEIISANDMNCVGKSTYTSGGTTNDYSINLALLLNQPNAQHNEYAPSARSNILYEFTWRGDPRLQPRDIINVDLNGTDTIMTIDSIQLSHENGGLTSQIVARKGVV